MYFLFLFHFLLTRMENMSSSHKITSVLIEITFLKQNEKLPYNYQEKDCTKYLVNKQCEIIT